MLHSILEGVTEALDRSGMAWCILGDVSALCPPGNRLDLLVDAAGAGRAAAILTEERFMPLEPPEGRAQAFFVSYDGRTDHWLQVRILTELSYGEYGVLRTHAATACLARRQREDGRYLLSPADRFWAVLLEYLLSVHALGPYDSACLASLAPAAELDSPLALVLDAVCPPGWTAARILDCVRQEGVESVETFGPLLSSAWLRHPHYGAPRRRWIGPLTNRLRALGLRPHPGLVVALVGTDGSGKSTLAAQIGRSYYFPVRTMYLGLWQRLPNGRSELRFPGLSLARRLLRVWRQYLVGQYYRMRGSLVIFDRYTYDALLASRSKRGAARLYAWILAHACPPPDLALLLDAPGKVVHARKPEATVEHLEAERQAFLSLQSLVPQLQIVDADCPQDSVRTDVLDRIWDRHFDHR